MSKFFRHELSQQCFSGLEQEDCRGISSREEQSERGSSHTSHSVILESETLQRSDTVSAALGICETPIQINYTDKKDQRVYAKIYGGYKCVELIYFGRMLQDGKDIL